MIKAVLLDDEPNSLKGLIWDLDNFCKDVEVLAGFTKPSEAVDFIRKNHIDCLFLDVEMPEMDGFSFLDNFYSRDFFVVFVTAFDQYALKAIKEAATDYLLKPIDTDELVKTIDKIKLLKKSQDIQKANVATNQRYALPVLGKIIYLRQEELLYCQSDGNYTRIFLTNGESIFVTKKIKEIHSLLDEHVFVRIHNSYVINFQKVVEFLKTDNYVILEGNIKIPVSRNNRKLFLNSF